MWNKIKDCGKQLTIFSRLRENEGSHYNLYQVIEVEFDQYKLQLISKNSMAAPEKLEQVFNCKKLIEYGFELEENGTAAAT